jgi:hypothetical protein
MNINVTSLRSSKKVKSFFDANEVMAIVMQREKAYAKRESIVGYHKWQRKGWFRYKRVFG